MVRRKPPRGSIPDSARIAFIQRAGVSIAVVSHALDVPECLSPAERAVCRMLLDGLSNRAIATARSTTERTVAKQVQRIFDKVGVGSRLELVAALVGTGGKSDAAKPRR